MSSISSTSASQVYAQRPSPQPHGSMQSRMTATLDSEVASGSLSSTDAKALTRALSAIDSSLSSDGGTAADGTGAARPRLDPASMKDRIDGLIADQVSSGGLTSDQAGALSNLFASHGRSTGTSDAAGPSGADGPPPGPPPSADAASDAASGRGSPASASGGSAASDLLATFIQQLQSAQAGGAGYAASGASAATQPSALLFDFKS